MRSAIIFLSVFATGALALPANLCAGPGDTTVLCTREDSTSTDRTLERREPISLCLGPAPELKTYFC
ncbi:hypothetical protein MCOR27_003109 [Pyricularia oryzae]|uniref:Pheromone n=1 Tax=Pyricularia grisea TaxID=148305 RepID=A0ABQ8NYB2_PYRGI|nr:hypothetical protein MCOR01_009262 [Pyricularia oryzae]KAI6303741.1 hypothetical protein MCOR33_001091 [Pyricularia grisea]KAH9437489.1 hypothetical protein MCOR02_001146 [Pyricularia oryzae]KAI6256060.1 hypothetical protein MCOR19_007462 [Pyricularia oryzae]KAI6265828.1 hypothetical protein MCOR26_010522 [Pyricularia oryzae]